MVVRRTAVAVMLLQALRTVNGVGREVLAPIEGEQIMAFVEDEGFQGLAALQVTEDVGETGTQGVRINRVKDFPQLRITGDALDAIDSAEIGVGILAAFVEGEQ